MPRPSGTGGFMSHHAEIDVIEYGGLLILSFRCCYFGRPLELRPWRRTPSNLLDAITTKLFTITTASFNSVVLTRISSLLSETVATYQSGRTKRRIHRASISHHAYSTSPSPGIRDSLRFGRRSIHISVRWRHGSWRCDLEDRMEGLRDFTAN